MAVQRLSGFGFNVGNSETIKAVNDFAQNIIVPHMRKLIKEKAYDKGGLYQSVRAEVVEGGGNSGIGAGGYEINIIIDDPAAEYLDFIEQGVRGKISSAKAPSSPYQFKGRQMSNGNYGPRGGLIRAISEWADRKGVGQYKFQIAWNVFRFGLSSRPILNPTFDYANQVLNSSYEQRLEQGFSDDMNRIIDKLIEQQNLNI